jgi:hypothetical protein
MGRGIAAGLTFLLAAAAGVLAAVLAAKPSAGLWVALGVLVVAGAVLQGALAVAERRSKRMVLASGPGAVAIGGSAGEVHTSVHGARGVAVADAAEVAASAPGAVSVGGDAAGPVVTEVSQPDGAGEL